MTVRLFSVVKHGSGSTAEPMEPEPCSAGKRTSIYFAFPGLGVRKPNRKHQMKQKLSQSRCRKMTSYVGRTVPSRKNTPADDDAAQSTDPL